MFKNPKSKLYFIIILMAVILMLGCLLSAAASAHESIPDNVSERSSPENNDDQVTAGGDDAHISTSEPGEETIIPVETDKIICIDPGHGWTDSGCVSSFTDKDGKPIYEKDINLAIAKYMKEELERRGYGVVMIRESDDLPSLSGSEGIVARTQWVNGQDKIALMISIHCDSYEDAAATGTRVYWYNANHPELTELGELLSTNLIFGEDPNSKIPLFPDTKGKFYPLTACSKPAVLVECGYLTNQKDAENLTDSEYQTAFGKALARSVDEYMRKRL